MKKFLERKWLTVAYGALLVIVGVLTLVYAIINPDVVTNVLSISIAVSLFIIGVANIAVALISHTSDFFNTSLLSGSISITVGVLLCIDRTLIAQFIAYLVGIFFIAFAVVALIKFILFIVYKQKVAWIVAYGFLTALSAAAGILILCFKDQTTQVLYGIIGSVIILAGLFEIIANIRAIHYKNKEDVIEVSGEVSSEKPVQEEPVENTAEEAPQD